MKSLQLLIVASILSACDGHVRRFDPPAPPVPQSSAGVAQEGIRLVTVLNTIATERGFNAAQTQAESQDYIVMAQYYKKSGNTSVQMKLLRDFASGSFHFEIVDWPSSQRSTESLEIEAEVLRRLQLPLVQAR
jgi:hypothetical protein